MRRGRHAAEDGSFGRSAGMAAGRGAALLAVAVAIGVILLNAADDEPGDRLAAGSDSATTEPQARGTTTLPPITTTTLPLRAPRDVKVLSANGTDVRGVAGKVRDVLRASGYNVLAPTDAKPATASAVYFAPAFNREAEAVAQALALPSTAVQPLPTPPPVPDVRGANVLVVVGPELAQRLAATTTTTTRRATTSTTARTATTSTTARATSTTSTTTP